MGYSYDRRTRLGSAPDSELQDDLRALDELRELDKALDHIETAFSSHFHIEAHARTGATVDPTVKTQLDVLKKALDGLKAAEEIAKSTTTVLQLYPEDKTAARAKKDAETMIARFQKHAEAARKIVRTISSKQMPPALKKLGNAAGKIVEERLIDPSNLKVIPWMGETWQKNALYSVVLRVSAPDLSKFVNYTNKPNAVDVTISVDSGTTEGPKFEGDYSSTKEALTPKSVAERLLKALRGWPGLKGETEAAASRKKDADLIASAMKNIAHRLGEAGQVEMSRDARTVTVDYRSHLPKEGAYGIDEYRYDEMVSEEMDKAKKAYEAGLALYKDKIESISYDLGEKGWVYAHVTLK